MNTPPSAFSRSPQILIRNAGPDDENAVDILLFAYFLDREDADISNFIVAEVNGKVIGALSCLEEPVSEVHSVAVHASYRGRGIGKSLLLHALSRTRGTVYVRTTAPGFFLKQGFKEVKDKRKEELWEDCLNCSHRGSCAQHVLSFYGE